MIKFAVFSKVRLTKKPAWLNKFEKGDIENNWHVTLKQPCYVKLSQVSGIKNKLGEINERIRFKDGRMNIQFDKLAVDKEKSNRGKTIMMRATRNKNIRKLQKKIITALKDFNDYCEEESQTWENNFKPHLTIASGLKEKEYLGIKKLIKNDNICEGVINGFALVYTKNDSRKTYINYKLRL